MSGTNYGACAVCGRPLTDPKQRLYVAGNGKWRGLCRQACRDVYDGRKPKKEKA